MNCRPFRVFFVLLILLGSGFRVQSQSSQGRFSGTVTDTSGAAVPNATINIENLGTHVSRTPQTNSSGDDVAQHRPGILFHHGRGQGFHQGCARARTVEVGNDLKIDFQLKVGTI